MSLTAEIKAEANALGFILSGVSLPQPPPHLPIYQSWIGAGRQAGMAYLAEERALQRRADPRLVLPEVRSIFSVGLAYASPIQQTRVRPASPAGRVAAYAWGADYHDLIPPRLDRLVLFLEQRLGRPVLNRRYTDTGPVLERDLAQQAGLGWIGKNTCLISPTTGSFILLAELFLDVELDPDPPFLPDHCGTCQRCSQACPTGCIRPDRTLDAARCISYLTIENKAAIPAPLRKQVGEWVFGCDICQLVCPWNLHPAPPPADPAFAARPGLPAPDLLAELELGPQEFNQKFRASPVQRARRRGYLRNVCVALGNQPLPEAAAPLARLLSAEPEPLIRAHAAWALGQVNTSAARSALQHARLLEADPQVLAEIISALEQVEK